MIFTTKIGAISANRRVAVFMTHPVEKRRRKSVDSIEIKAFC